MNNERNVPSRLYWSLYHKKVQLERENEKLLIENNFLKNKFILNNISEERRCSFIRSNGKRCRQKGLPHQNGGEIINGYCQYHQNKI